jgi:DNA-binding response OmpR family regulator
VIAKPNAESAPGTAGGNVLVVEDNFGVANALAGVIRRAGFDATACHSGADALDHCRSARPVAAVVDIHLPDFSGLVLANKLRGRLGDEVPIIIVSGDTSMDTLKSLAHAGATYFFSKPVNPNVLVARLKELIDDNAERVAR